jgi:hypothetical protein
MVTLWMRASSSKSPGLSKRLKETQQLTERKVILKKARQVIEEMDALVGTDRTKQNIRDSKTQGSD